MDYNRAVMKSMIVRFMKQIYPLSKLRGFVRRDGITAPCNMDMSTMDSLEVKDASGKPWSLDCVAFDVFHYDASKAMRAGTLGSSHWYVYLDPDYILLDTMDYFAYFTDGKQRLKVGFQSSWEGKLVLQREMLHFMYSDYNNNIPMFVIESSTLSVAKMTSNVRRQGTFLNVRASANLEKILSCRMPAIVRDGIIGREYLEHPTIYLKTTALLKNVPRFVFSEVAKTIQGSFAVTKGELL